MAKIKGQHLRLFISEEVIAAATSCQLSVNAEVETVSTKDDTSIWDEKEVKRLNWSVQTEAMVLLSDPYYILGDLLQMQEDKEVISIDFATAEGTGMRSSIAWGDAIITDISVNAPNGQYATMSVTMTGVGELSVTGNTVNVPGSSSGITPGTAEGGASGIGGAGEGTFT